MKPQQKPQSWLRFLIATQVSLILAAGQFGCTSSSKQKADDADEPAAQEEALNADGDFTDEIGQPAAADASADGVNDALAAEELGTPADPSANASAAPVPAPAPAAPEPSAPAEAPRSQEVAAAPEAPKAGGQAGFTGNYSEVAVTDIKYLSKRAGGTVLVETSAPATYHTREVPGQNQAIIEIANAQLPERLKRPYVTKDFGQEITSVMAYQDKGSSTVRVVVQFKSPLHADVKQEGRNLMLASADAFGGEDNPTLGDMGGDSPAAADGDEIPSEGRSPKRYSNHDSRILPATSVDPTGYDNLKFFGKPISIEVRDTPVRDVINLIAEQSGANIVLAGEIDGNITLKLRQIPWDQALLIVMKTRNLGYVRQGSILRVAPYDSLQKETEAAKRVIDAQKASEPLRVKVIPVGYAKVADLEKQLGNFLTKERGKVVADPRTNSLVVTDTPDVLERIGNLVKVLDLPPLQVLIEGKVVEARETFGRNLGVNWGFNGADVALGNRSLNANFNTNGLGLPLTGGVGGIRVGQFDFFGDINAQLGLAETEDQVKILSSPRIVALNNEPASITQGTSIPQFQISQLNGVTTTTVSYTKVPLKLDVTPQVTSENDVIMQIDIVRNFAGNRVQNVPPDINEREAKTKVLVRNGQTAVIGGVYQSDSTETDSGIPFLRNLPVLGWLFKTRNTTLDKNELLVFLTPRILNADTSLQKENTL